MSRKDYLFGFTDGGHVTRSLYVNLPCYIWTEEKTECFFKSTQIEKYNKI